MELYDVRIYKNDDSKINIDPEWNHKFTNRSNFLYSKDTNLSIKVDGRVKTLFLDNFKYTRTNIDTESVKISSTKVETGIKYVKAVSNRYSLNPVLYPMNGNVDGTTETMLIHLVLDTSSFSVMRYNSNFNVIATYRKFNEYQGCLISVPMNIKDNETDEVIELLMLDKESNRFKKITLTVTNHGCSSITGRDIYVIDRKEENLTKVELGICRKVSKKNEGKSLGFKYNLCSNDDAAYRIYTNVFICKESDISSDKISDIVNSKNYTVISIEDDKIEDVDYVVNKINDTLKNIKVRAITEYNMALPVNVFKQLKILYVFKLQYNKDGREYIYCLKSN